MKKRKDDILRLRVSRELKEKIRAAAEVDPETDSMSEWGRKELRAAMLLTLFEHDESQ